MSTHDDPDRLVDDPEAMARYRALFMEGEIDDRARLRIERELAGARAIGLLQVLFLGQHIDSITLALRAREVVAEWEATFSNRKDATCSPDSSSES